MIKSMRILAAAFTAAFVISAAGAAGLTAVTAVSVVTASEAQAQETEAERQVRQANRRAVLKRLKRQVRKLTQVAKNAEEKLAASAALLPSGPNISSLLQELAWRTSWSARVTGPGILPFGGRGDSRRAEAPSYVPSTATVTTVSWAIGYESGRPTRYLVHEGQIVAARIASSGSADLSRFGLDATGSFSFTFIFPSAFPGRGGPSYGTTGHTITVNYRA